MSMNLCFMSGKYFIEFPYQTSTNTTYAVLNASSLEERIDLIRKELEECESLELLPECIEMMTDKSLVLSII